MQDILSCQILEHFGDGMSEDEARLAHHNNHHHIMTNSFIVQLPPQPDAFIMLRFLILFQTLSNLAYKAEDDDELFSNGPRIQLNASNSPAGNQQTTEHAAAAGEFSETLPRSLRRSIYDNAFEDDNDSEMASFVDVSDPDNNDNSLQASSNSFARTFFNNTRRRMSSGLVLSYHFLKGGSGQRRDST